jgi:hypothetical protein
VLGLARRRGCARQNKPHVELCFVSAQEGEVSADKGFDLSKVFLFGEVDLSTDVILVKAHFVSTFLLERKPSAKTAAGNLWPAPACREHAAHHHREPPLGAAIPVKVAASRRSTPLADNCLRAVF